MYSSVLEQLQLIPHLYNLVMVFKMLEVKRMLILVYILLEDRFIGAFTSQIIGIMVSRWSYVVAQHLTNSNNVDQLIEVGIVYNLIIYH